VAESSGEATLAPQAEENGLATSALAPHLARLPGGDWAVWSWICVRGAGFPGDRILDVASPECAQAADRLVAAPPGEMESARGDYEEAYAQAEHRLFATLQGVARDEPFREAVLWQNRQAFKTGVEPFLRPRAADQGMATHEARRRARLIVSYLQRYCTKNDTIGFFGPVGWARCRAGGEALTVRCGPDLVAERQVFFEDWCIDALAEAFAAGFPLRAWVAPRRLPFFHLEEALSELQRAVLAACDGERCATEISSSLPRSQDEIFAVLEGLEERGLIAWTLDVPKAPDGERELRRRLERVGDDELRRRLLGELDALAAARDALAHVQGDSAALDHILGQVEDRFCHLTGRPATRFGGLAYGSRTLMYHDCRRDVEIEIGPQLLERLGPPLSLVLDSARWLTDEIARRFRPRWRAVYEELREREGKAAVDFAAFLKRTGPVLRSSLIAGCVADLQERWAQVLQPPGEPIRERYACTELLPRVRESFAAPGPGWRSARQHSPDVLIDAASVEAIRRGEYQLVFGECHLAANSLRRPLFPALHPRPEDLEQAMACDFPDPSVVPFLPKLRERPGQEPPAIGRRRWSSARLDVALIKADDFRLDYMGEPLPDSAARILRIGDLMIADEAGELVVRTRDGRHRFALMDVLDSALTAESAHDFAILPPRPHQPRITVDHLVIQRETWRVELREATFLHAATRSDRYLEARRWAQSLGMPRFVFVKAPDEVKPFFVDFDSPATVAVLAHTAARALRREPGDTTLAVSEMLPDLHHRWLPDARGQRYTSELRMVAVDLRGR